MVLFVEVEIAKRQPRDPFLFLSPSSTEKPICDTDNSCGLTLPITSFLNVFNSMGDHSAFFIKLEDE